MLHLPWNAASTEMSASVHLAAHTMAININPNSHIVNWIGFYLQQHCYNLLLAYTHINSCQLFYSQTSLMVHDLTHSNSPKQHTVCDNNEIHNGCFSRIWIHTNSLHSNTHRNSLIFTLLNCLSAIHEHVHNGFTTPTRLADCLWRVF